MPTSGFILKYSNSQLEDLYYLWNMLDMSLFISQSKQLNPTIGQFGTLITSSDADLILDNKMIDIKTTKPKKDLDNLIQSLCYLIMYNCKFKLKNNYLDKLEEKEFGSIYKNKDLLNEVGIYYSRHGEYVYIDLNMLTFKELNLLYKSFVNSCY